MIWEKRSFQLKVAAILTVLGLVLPPSAWSVAPELASQKEDARTSIAEKLMAGSPVIPFEWARAAGLIRDYDPNLAGELAQAIAETNAKAKAEKITHIRNSALPSFVKKLGLAEEETNSIVNVIQNINPQNSGNLTDALQILKKQKLGITAFPQKKTVRAASLGDDKNKIFEDKMKQFRRLDEIVRSTEKERKKIEAEFKKNKGLLSRKDAQEILGKTLLLAKEVYEGRLTEPFKSLKEFDPQQLKEAVENSLTNPKGLAANDIAAVFQEMDRLIKSASAERRKLNFELLKYWGPFLRSFFFGTENPFYRLWQYQRNKFTSSRRWRVGTGLILAAPIITLVANAINREYEKKWEIEQENARAERRVRREAREREQHVINFITQLRSQYDLPMIDDEYQDEILKKALDGNLDILKDLEAQSIVEGYFKGSIPDSILFQSDLKLQHPATILQIGKQTIETSRTPLVEALRNKTGVIFTTETGNKLDIRETPGGYSAIILNNYYQIRKTQDSKRAQQPRLSREEFRGLLQKLKDGRVKIEEINKELNRMIGGRSLGAAEMETFGPRDYLYNTAIRALDLVRELDTLPAALVKAETLYGEADKYLGARSDAEKKEIMEAFHFAAMNDPVIALQPNETIQDIVAQSAVIKSTLPNEIDEEDLRSTLRVLQSIDPRLILYIISDGGLFYNLLGNQVPIPQEDKTLISRLLDQENIKERSGDFSAVSNELLKRFQRQGALISDSKQSLLQGVFNTDVMALFNMKNYAQFGDMPVVILNVLGRLAREKDKLAYLAKLREYGINREGLLIVIDLNQMIDKVVNEYRAHQKAVVSA